MYWALAYPPALAAFGVTTLLYGGYQLLFRRDKSYPAISSAIDNLSDLFADEPEITKGTKVTEETKREFLDVQIQSVNTTMKKVVVDNSSKTNEQTAEIHMNKQDAIYNIDAKMKEVHAETKPVVKDVVIPAINSDVSGDSLVDVIRNSANLKTDQMEKMQEIADFQTTLIANQNELSKEHNELMLGMLTAMQVQSIHLDHIATILTDTMVPIAESSALMPHLIKTINIGNQATVESMNLNSKIQADIVAENLELTREATEYKKKEAELAEFELEGSNEGLTWSGQQIKPALAKAKKNYELSKTEGQMNKLDAYDLDTFDMSDFNILSYMMSKIKEDK